jgi:hypothetical protein
VPALAYLCYAKPDRSYVERLSMFLMDNGVPNWYDSSDDVNQPSRKLVAGCGVLLVVVSRRSVTTPVLQWTVARADEAHRPTICLMRSEVALPVLLQGRQRVPMRSNVMPSRMLLEQIRDLTGYYEPTDEELESTTSVPTPAPRRPRFQFRRNHLFTGFGMLGVAACAAWQPAAALTVAGAFVSFIASLAGGIATFFRALF